MTILMGKRKPKWNLLLRIFQFKLGNGLFVLHRGMSLRVFSLFVAPPSFPLWRNLQLLLLLHPIYPTLSCHTWMNLGSSTKQNRSSLSPSSREKASIFTREIIALWKTKCRYTPSKKSRSSHFLPLNLLPNGWCNTSFFSQPGSKDFAILKWCWRKCGSISKEGLLEQWRIWAFNPC